MIACLNEVIEFLETMHTLGQRVPLSCSFWEERIQELGRPALEWNNGMHGVVGSAVVVENSEVNWYIWKVGMLAYYFVYVG